MRFFKVSFLLIISFLYIAAIKSQPLNWYGDITTSDNTFFIDTPMYDRGAIVSTNAIQATITKSHAKFLFNTAPANFNPKWTGSSTSTSRPKNLKLDAEAYYGNDEYWQQDFEVSVISGNYYTFISGKNSISNNDMSILETNFLPSTINNMIQTPISTNVYSNDDVEIIAEMNQFLNNGEYLFVRYTTDSWNTSAFISMVQTGATTFKANIPAMLAGTHVKYYVLTTINSSPQHSDIDFLTLAISNNNNLNYEYLVQGVPSYSGILNRQLVFNEGTNYYNDFSQTHLGTYGNTALLTLKGAQLTTWKTNPDDITGAAMYYRIYEQGAVVLPDFDTVNLPWLSDLLIPGNQIWENDTLMELILYPLNDGLYNLEVFFEAFYSDGLNSFVHIDDNSGSNYLLTFEIDNSIYYGTCTIDALYLIIDTLSIEYITANDWDGMLIGVYNPISNFYLNGMQAKTLKTGIFDVLEVRAFYRYYVQGSNPPAFSSLVLPFDEDLPYPGHQVWSNDTFNHNIISALTFGTYEFEVYFEVDYKKGLVPLTYTLTDDNNQSYYKAYFDFVPFVLLNNIAFETRMKAFPNPTNNLLCFEGEIKNCEKIIIIRDILGNQLWKAEKYLDKCLSLQAIGLCKGVYVLEIYTSNYSFSQKIILQ